MKTPSLVMIAVAIVWALVIIALDMVLHGTPYAGRALQIVGGGVAATLIMLGGSRLGKSADRR